MNSATQQQSGRMPRKCTETNWPTQPANPESVHGWGTVQCYVVHSMPSVLHLSLGPRSWHLLDSSCWTSFRSQISQTSKTSLQEAWQWQQQRCSLVWAVLFLWIYVITCASSLLLEKLSTSTPACSRALGYWTNAFLLISGSPCCFSLIGRSEGSLMGSIKVDRHPKQIMMLWNRGYHKLLAVSFGFIFGYLR